MSNDNDRLTLEGVRRYLDTQVVGQHIYIFDSVDSTNDALARLADRGATEGTVVMAEAQTAGRGRHGSAWFSPATESLYVSVLFRPAIAPRELPLFAPIASLALAEAVWLEGAPARIKWPNDVVVHDRKVGGVLVQAPVIEQRLAHVILGVGVNLNVPPAELAVGLGAAAEHAASLHELVEHPIDRNQFAASLLTRLEKWHRTHQTRGPAAVHAAWGERDALHGRRIEAWSDGELRRGWADGIDADGTLIVVDDAGHPHHVLAGAVRILDDRAKAASA
jgi:BirA family transcriptional regulator, biotin operon repressor / biotin---[acetyl-CoA-carboxylase] ligase